MRQKILFCRYFSLSKRSLLPKYKLLISYDGTQYGGWQVQPNAIAIQPLIENALEKILRHPVQLAGSGRTDSGVHALGQTAHFTTELLLEEKKHRHCLNGLLPPDIRVQRLTEVPNAFHARFSAQGKTYRYHLDSGPVQSPFKRLYCYHLPFRIDLETLKKALPYFIGEHDFTAFSNESHRGSAARNPIRTIERLDLHQKGTELTLEFEGNGFLYKMVRNIVGTMLDIARGKIALESLPEIFASKNRSKAGTTAPPHGLFLVSVKY